VNRLAVLAVTALGLVGCNVDIDEPWELDHDRIIAVRAEPPGIQSGETSRLDVLLGYEELPLEVKRPDVAQVVSPQSLADLVRFDGTDWVVTAPSEERIAAARAELMIEGDAPVPLVLGIGVAWPTPVMSPMQGFGATKTVWLGVEYVNPTINGLTIDGAEPPTEDVTLVFAKAKGSAAPPPRTALFVEADDQRDIVNWLTSCGTMHDFDLSASAYITVEEEDRTEGQFALVLRDELGGVSWRYWNCRAE
jgi:hypothetical protein